MFNRIRGYTVLKLHRKVVTRTACSASGWVTRLRTPKGFPTRAVGRLTMDPVVAIYWRSFSHILSTIEFRCYMGLFLSPWIFTRYPSNSFDSSPPSPRNMALQSNVIPSSPERIRSRGYQMEMLDESLKRNIIVAVRQIQITLSWLTLSGG